MSGIRMRPLRFRREYGMKLREGQSPSDAVLEFKSLHEVNGIEMYSIDELCALLDVSRKTVADSFINQGLSHYHLTLYRTRRGGETPIEARPSVFIPSNDLIDWFLDYMDAEFDERRYEIHSFKVPVQFPTAPDVVHDAVYRKCTAHSNIITVHSGNEVQDIHLYLHTALIHGCIMSIRQLQDYLARKNGRMRYSKTSALIAGFVSNQFTMKTNPGATRPSFRRYVLLEDIRGEVALPDIPTPILHNSRIFLEKDWRELNL